MPHMIFDIALNITDTMYSGIYNGIKKHDSDHETVLSRSYTNNITPFFVGNNLTNSFECLRLSRMYNTYCYAGIHPNDASTHKHEIHAISEFILSNINTCNHEKHTDTNPNFQFFQKPINNLVAVGECGLDYYHTISDKKDQKEVFQALLNLNCDRYFLHSRDSHRDMMDMLCDYKFKKVIHSFDGTIEDALEIIKLGCYIGINGHSLKKVGDIREIDMNRVMVESDAPYCRMGKTYEGYQYIKTFFDETKKYSRDKVFRRRNEPVNTVQVVEVLSAIYNIEMDDLKSILYQNTSSFFEF